VLSKRGYLTSNKLGDCDIGVGTNALWSTA